MLHAPVLELNVARMHEIDPRNVENLFGMWTVFSKCANTIAEGKRLENLSWRVWARETLCCPPQPERTIVPAINIPLPMKDDVPSLSHSFCSDSDESVASSTNSALSKSRGKEPHLTPSTLEKIVTNIQEQEKQRTLKPLDPAIEACVVAKLSEKEDDLSVPDSSDHRPMHYSTESSCLSTSTNNTVSTERDVAHRDSDTSVSSNGPIRVGSVVHGFSPVTSVRSRTDFAKNKSTSAANSVKLKSTGPLKSKGFLFPGSSGEESSFEERMSYKRSITELRKSSLSKSLTRNEMPPQKKTTSFREVLEQHTNRIGGSPADDNAIASDEDDESVIDDSAIEEDDEEGWEDEQPEEVKPSHPVFRRVDSTAHLPSQRSVLTAGLTEGDRAQGLLNAASRSSPAIRRSDKATSQPVPVMSGSSEQNDEDSPMMMRSTGNTKAIPISLPTNATVYALAHSPRTTRRNMLSTELTESLRKNLLWERQQKNTTVNAFLKREAKSMANLQRAGQTAEAQPAPPRALLRDPTRNNHSYNDYFNVASEYHTKGW